MPKRLSGVCSAASVVVPARTPMRLPSSWVKSSLAPAGVSTLAPSAKVGTVKSTISRRARVIVAAPQSRSMRPSATA